MVRRSSFIARKRKGRFSYGKSKKGRTARRMRTGKRSAYVRRRMGSRKSSIVSRIKVSNPNMQVATTYFGNTKTRQMAISASRYSIAQRNLWGSSDGIGIQAGAGFQSLSEFYLGSRAQLINAVSATIGQGPSGGVGNLTNTNRIFYSHADMYMNFTNSTNIVAFVTLYHMVARRDGFNGIKTLMIDGLMDEQNSSVVDYSRYVGVTPGTSNSVLQFWKPKKVFELALQPGQTYQHMWRNNMYRAINNELLNSTNTSSTFMGGITQGLLIQTIGAAVSATSGVTATTGPVQLDIVTNVKYYFKYIDDNDMNVKMTTNLSGTTGQIYNQGSGAATAVQAIA